MNEKLNTDLDIWGGAGSGLETPCLVIDSSVVDANIAAMSEVAKRNGVQLRPHAKTHKLPEMAARQIAAGAAGITVAKISEAEVMAEGGITDIFVAYPLVAASKIERAIRLSQAGVRLIVGADSLEGAKRISEAAAREGVVLEIRLEIETGLRRTGVRIDDAVQLAKQIAALDGIRLTGIFTYRGAIHNGTPTLHLRAAGHEEGLIMASLATALRSEGLAIQDVSVGSTPTAAYAAEIVGVTEIRPGTYIYQDRMQAAFGVSTIDDCAGAVLATVISRPSDDLIVIDGGSKTFATDVQPGTSPLCLQGFGHIVGAPDAVLERMTEEHGMIRVRTDALYRVGDLIRIIPNHICSTVNLHNFVYIADAAGQLRKAAVAARGMLE